MRFAFRKRPTLLGAAAAASILVVPGVTAFASADPSVSTPLGCWIEAGHFDQKFAINGSGFQPNTELFMSYESPGAPPGQGADVTTDANGDLSSAFTATTVFGGVPPVPLTVGVSSTDGESTLASFTVPVAQQGRGDRWVPDIRGDIATRWQFAGYPNATIYAHFAYLKQAPRGGFFSHYRYVATTTFGPTSGPCGVLNVRRPLFEGLRTRVGWWQIQFDTNRRYHRARFPTSMVMCGDILGPAIPGRYPPGAAHPSVPPGTWVRPSRARVFADGCGT